MKTAQRLQSNAGPGKIIISAESYEKVKEYFKCDKIGEVKMKNKVNPIVLYQLIE